MSFGRAYVIQEDLTKAARKVSEAKKHESKSFYYLCVKICIDGLWFLAKLDYSA